MLNLVNQIRQKVTQATLSGDLKTLYSDRYTISDGSLEYSVNVKRATVTSERPMNLTPGLPPKDPFMPPHEQDWNSRYSNDYTLLLNKFNVMNNHVLIITKHFESQFAPLSGSCLQVMHEVVVDADGFGFYNAGKEAGPSQSHRHMQVVTRADNALPFYDLITESSKKSEIGVPFSSEQFKFRHSICQIAQETADPASFLSWYNACLKHSSLLPVPMIGDRVDLNGPINPHNVLMGINWLMVVPRTLADLHEIPGNGLNFIGSFYIRNQSQFETLKTISPMNVLIQLGVSSSKL